MIRRATRSSRLLLGDLRVRRVTRPPNAATQGRCVSSSRRTCRPAACNAGDRLSSSFSHREYERAEASITPGFEGSFGVYSCPKEAACNQPVAPTGRTSRPSFPAERTDHQSARAGSLDVVARPPRRFRRTRGPSVPATGVLDPAIGPTRPSRTRRRRDADDCGRRHAVLRGDRGKPECTTFVDASCCRLATSPLASNACAGDKFLALPSHKRRGRDSNLGGP